MPTQSRPWTATFAPKSPSETTSRFAGTDAIDDRARALNQVKGGPAGGHFCFMALHDDGTTYDCRHLHEAAA